MSGKYASRTHYYKVKPIFPQFGPALYPYPLMTSPLISLSRPDTWVSSLTLILSLLSLLLLNLMTFLYSTLVQATIISLVVLHWLSN